MSATTDKESWIKSVLGFDVIAARGEPLQGKDHEGEDSTQERGGFLDFLSRKVGELSGERPELPKDKALAAALDKLDDQIEAVGKLGFDTKRLTADRNDAAWAGDKAEKMPAGDPRDAALAAAKKRIADIEAHAKALADSCASVMGASKAAPTAAQKSQIYQKALETHYGIKVENKDGMANTHLDRVFDMFGTVPIGDAKQDKLTELRYDKTMKGGGAYSPSQCYIVMGEFGDASGGEDYVLNGEVLPVNSFDVTTLHEIGHAVDNKHGVMSGNRSKAGCGGWNPETAASVADAYLKEAKASLKLSDKVAEPDLLAAISTALSTGGTAKPGTIEQDDWLLIVGFLTDKVLKSRADNRPWYRGAPVVGGRVYQEAYSNQWWSYDDGAKSATKVNGYQWRAPGEWFAEIYAITWMKKKKPPSAVDASAAAYMWNG